MQELIDKYKKQYKDVPREWKTAMITKMMQDPATFVDVNGDIDWLYDEAVYYLFDSSKTKVKNLAKKLGYDKIPCETCRKIIEHWNDNDEWMYSEDRKHLFKSVEEKC